MQLFKKCMDTALLIPCFIKKRRSPTPWRPQLKCLKNCFCIKNRFEPFSRGLPGVGNLLFFIKYGIFKAVSMHFLNNCMHAPFIVVALKIVSSKIKFIIKNLTNQKKPHGFNIQTLKFSVTKIKGFLQEDCKR